MAYDVPQLLAMSQTQLDDLFRASPPGDIPNGPAAGTAIIAPGTNIRSRSRRSSITSAGRAKSSTPKRARSRTGSWPSAWRPSSPRSTRRRAGSTTRSASCSITRDTSLVAHWIRDEIRLIGPGFYLGKVYWGKERLIDFCLKF